MGSFYSNQHEGNWALALCQLKIVQKKACAKPKTCYILTMKNEKEYNQMLTKFRSGQMTQEEWYSFCQQWLMDQPVWLGVVKRLSLK